MAVTSVTCSNCYTVFKIADLKAKLKNDRDGSKSKLDDQKSVKCPACENCVVYREIAGKPVACKEGDSFTVAPAEPVEPTV